MKKSIIDPISLLINKTWEGELIAASEIGEVVFGIDGNGLTIEIDAPFHNDPAPIAPPGSTDGLWEYEVVELFLASAGSEYIEIECGPYGHYLVLLFNGERQRIADGIVMDYKSAIHDNRWQAKASLESTFLPRPITRVNGYAIHGTGSGRRYLSAFPVPGEAPDFHQLRFFKACAELLPQK